MATGRVSSFCRRRGSALDASEWNLRFDGAGAIGGASTNAFDQFNFWSGCGEFNLDSKATLVSAGLGGIGGFAGGAGGHLGRRFLQQANLARGSGTRWLAEFATRGSRAWTTAADYSTHGGIVGTAGGTAFGTWLSGEL